MRKQFLHLRHNHTINQIGRSFLSIASLISKKFYTKFSTRWWISGIVDIKFLGYNFKMKSECDDATVNILYYQNSHSEENELYIFSLLSKKSRSIIDVGAHTGIYSIVAAISNPGAKIFSFEPHPFNFKRLTENIDLNKLTNVKLINNAVGDAVSTVKFNIPDDNRIIDVGSVDKSFSTKMYKGEVNWKEIDVAQTSIDAFCKTEINQNVDLIKIDVENYELQVFKGLQSIITTDKPFILCEIFHTEEKVKFIDDLLTANHYYVYDFTKEGLAILTEGINKYPSGLNYLLSPINLGSYISYKSFHSIISDY